MPNPFFSGENARPNGENTRPNGENTRPNGENTRPRGLTISHNFRKNGNNSSVFEKRQK